ncbi:MAG: accessory factor UbiK family protein [Neisseriaceae bacterium]
MSLSRALLEELTFKLSELVKNSPAKDIEKNLKYFLSSVLSRMDLVTRDEFELQQAQLRKASETIRHLEERLDKLENASGKAARTSVKASTLPVPKDVIKATSPAQSDSSLPRKKISPKRV